MIVVGTAGWNVPRSSAAEFPTDGSHLARYAARMPCVEIDTSAYRPHRHGTYARWRDATPDRFRFAVKLPRSITHDARLACERSQLESFAAEVAGLGPKLEVLLVQLPPSLAYLDDTVDRFFRLLRGVHHGAIACEPRHPSWFDEPADARMRAHRVARVAADPARVADAARPGGWPGLRYFRWHGSPVTYRSAYDDAWLAERVSEVTRGVSDAWCIFDNTAAGAALGDALRFAARVDALGH